MPVGEQSKRRGVEGWRGGVEGVEDGTGEVDLGEKLFNQVTPRSEPSTPFFISNYLSGHF